MDIKRLDSYNSRGARAMIIMHDQYLRECIDIWEKFNKSDAELPKTDDGDYKSKLHLLRHILRAARGYITWACEQLELPDPEIPSTPEIDELGGCYREYMYDLLAKWQLPLTNIKDADMFIGVYESRWKKPYTIDSMLEHAVMHPLRHSFQMRELMES